MNLNHCFLKIVRKSSDSDESSNQLIKSPTKSRIVFLKNDSSKTLKTENIQVTVHTTDNQVKKESFSDTKLVKKPIRRKVYLNKQKPLQEEQKHVLEKKSSNEDESNFEPNYFDEEFDKMATKT